jgi:hypothetical protein
VVKRVARIEAIRPIQASNELIFSSRVDFDAVRLRVPLDRLANLPDCRSPVHYDARGASNTELINSKIPKDE